VYVQIIVQLAVFWGWQSTRPQLNWDSLRFRLGLVLVLVLGLGPGLWPGQVSFGDELTVNRFCKARARDRQTDWEHRSPDGARTWFVSCHV